MAQNIVGASNSGSLYAVFRQAWDLSAPFVETVDGRCWTYADLDHITAHCSRQLQSAGLVKGDRLVSQLDRSPWNLFLYLACLRAGIIYVPISPQMTPPEAAPILADAEPAAVVCAPQLEEANRTLVRDTAAVVLTLDTEGEGSLAALPADARFAPDADVDSAATAAIVFTSGTTGRPKGAVLPHVHLWTKAGALAQTLGYRRDDKLLHTMPLYHAHGLFMTTHCVLKAGASMLLLPRFEAGDVIDRLPSVTLFSGVATMYKRMLGLPSLRENARGIRAFIAGSAPLPADLFLAFEEQSRHQIIECWGMSETMTNTANPLQGPRKPGSAGKPLPGVEVRVVDETGQPCAPGKPGVLSVRASTRFDGYWRRPEAEQPRFDDGFFPTGDLGYFDPEGYLFIVGRTGDVIISGGYNVYPREVELALEQIDGVQKAAVFGLPHPDYGEAVAAAIERTPGSTIGSQEAVAHLKQCLASYKAPKALFIVDSLPLTELGKIQRRVLADRFRAHFLQPESTVRANQ
jgi:malonyl-CoA/methylmalonyl-CoA synthetase